MTGVQTCALPIWVESTYLSIFLVLGTLGVILGTAGLAVVVLKNISERKNEFGLLRALGFKQRSVFAAVVLEHGMILAAGLGTGLLSALIAVLPSLSSGHSNLSPRTLLLLGAIISANGLLWTALATRTAFRQNPVTALRQE